jgi:hypothetical protein
MEARPPAEKSPRWSAERRASRVMGRVRASPARQQSKVRLSALRPPSSGMDAITRTNPGAKTRPRERKKTAPFDIVDEMTANGSSREPRLRTPAARGRSLMDQPGSPPPA